LESVKLGTLRVTGTKILVSVRGNVPTDSDSTCLGDYKANKTQPAWMYLVRSMRHLLPFAALADTHNIATHPDTSGWLGIPNLLIGILLSASG